MEWIEHRIDKTDMHNQCTICRAHTWECAYIGDRNSGIEEEEEDADDEVE